MSPGPFPFNVRGGGGGGGIDQSFGTISSKETNWLRNKHKEQLQQVRNTKTTDRWMKTDTYERERESSPRPVLYTTYISFASVQMHRSDFLKVLYTSQMRFKAVDVTAGCVGMSCFLGFFCKIDFSLLIRVQDNSYNYMLVSFRTMSVKYDQILNKVQHCTTSLSPSKIGHRQGHLLSMCVYIIICRSVRSKKS